MESRISDCAALHNKGFNCAQAVACAYADLVDVEMSLSAPMASAILPAAASALMFRKPSGAQPTDATTGM